MSHRLTIKGQVTIPKEIRDFLGLEEGCSCVEFVVEADGSVSVRKAGEKPRSSRSSRTSSVQTVRKPVHVFARAPMAAFSPCLRAVSDGITPVDVSVSAA